MANPADAEVEESVSTRLAAVAVPVLTTVACRRLPTPAIFSCVLTRVVSRVSGSASWLDAFVKPAVWEALMSIRIGSFQPWTSRLRLTSSASRPKGWSSVGTPV